MKKVVNYFIILLIIAFTGCKSEETKQKEREEVYFLNEDFTIIEKSENIETNDSRALSVYCGKKERLRNLKALMNVIHICLHGYLKDVIEY